MTLDKGVPYSWNITSKNTKTTTTTTSDTWKFYLAGTGITNYAPFPADLKTPTSGSTVERTDGKVTFTWEGSDPDSGDTLELRCMLTRQMVNKRHHLHKQDCLQRH